MKPYEDRAWGTLGSCVKRWWRAGKAGIERRRVSWVGFPLCPTRHQTVRQSIPLAMELDERMRKRMDFADKCAVLARSTMDWHGHRCTKRYAHFRAFVGEFGTDWRTYFETLGNCLVDILLSQHGWSHVVYKVQHRRAKCEEYRTSHDPLNERDYSP